MKNYIEVPKTNIFIDLILISFLVFGFFINFSEPVQALVKKYTSGQITAEINYPKYTKEDKVSIEIEAYGVKEIFLDGHTVQNKFSVNLIEGNNTFLISLVGKKETQDHEITIIKDTKAPQLAEDQKKVIDITKTQVVTISFSEPLKLAQINDSNCNQIDGVKWSCNVNEGDNILSFSDLVGNETQDTIKGTQDHENPKILSEVPKTINQKPYQLKLEISHDTLNAFLNEKEIEINKYFIVFDLAQDKNEFTIKLIDEAGNEGEYSYTVTYKKPETQVVIVNPDNGNGTTPTDPDTGGGTQPSGCYGFQLGLSQIKGQVFVGETQTTILTLICTTTGKGYANQSVSLTVRYSNGSMKTFSGTTNANGVTNFSWTIPDIKGLASVTGYYSTLNAEQKFTVY